MCININDIHKTIIFLYRNSVLTRNYDDGKDAMLAPNKRGQNNNCID